MNIDEWMFGERRESKRGEKEGSREGEEDRL